MYIYVLAAAIAVIGILIFYKRNVEQIKENPEQVQKAHTNFFIGAAVSEALPIMLLVLGFVNQEPVTMEEIYLPLIIVAGLLVFAVLFIFLQRAVDVVEEAKQAVNNFAMISVTMVAAIPIVAIVFMFLSVQ